jgi:hypothetical protein
MRLALECFAKTGMRDRNHAANTLDQRLSA